MTETSTGGRGGQRRGRGSSPQTLSRWTWLSAVSCVLIRWGGGGWVPCVVGWVQCVVGWVLGVVGWVLGVVGWVPCVVGWVLGVVGWVQCVVGWVGSLYSP